MARLLIALSAISGIVAIATPSSSKRAAELPKHHLDPFDRVLIAHALRDDLELLTRDGVFASYGVRLATPAATAD